MEWTNSNILALISEYKMRPLLWDQTNKDFTNNLKKKAEIKIIGQILNCNELEVERKWKVLKGQLKRELNRLKRKEATGLSDGKRNWYWLGPLSFLLKNYKTNGIGCGSGSSGGGGGLSKETIKFSIDQTDPGYEFTQDNFSSEMFDKNTIAASAAVEFNPKKQLKILKRKRKRSTTSLSIKKAFNMIKEFDTKQKQDDLNIYGECLISKIRQIKNEKIRLLLQKDIDNLIYDALMGNGKYSNAAITTNLATAQSSLSTFVPSPGISSSQSGNVLLPTTTASDLRTIPVSCRIDLENDFDVKSDILQSSNFDENNESA